VLGHRRAQVGQPLGESNQAVILLLLLLRPECRVVEVLASTCLVQAGGLQLRVWARRDPDVLPRRWDDERLDARKLRLVADAVSARVVIPKATA
jgi:hypothetical protein